jgi:hypothetical protein
LLAAAFGFALGFGALLSEGTAAAAPTAVTATCCGPLALVAGASCDVGVVVVFDFVAAPIAKAIANAPTTTSTAISTKPRDPPLGGLDSADWALSTRPTSPVALTTSSSHAPQRHTVKFIIRSRRLVSELRELTHPTAEVG